MNDDEILKMVDGARKEGYLKGLEDVMKNIPYSIEETVKRIIDRMKEAIE